MQSLSSYRKKRNFAFPNPEHSPPLSPAAAYRLCAKWMAFAGVRTEGYWNIHTFLTLGMQKKNTSETLKERTARGMFWSAFGNGAQQAVTMLTGIALARMLDVEDYGMVALLTVFTVIAGNIQESGFTSALGVRRDVKSEDFNAVFWFSVGVSAILYVLLFLVAPFIADFNHCPELTLLARVAFVGFFISSLGTAQSAWLFRNLMVREKTSSQVLASFAAGIVGLSAAACGWGCWALVAMDLMYKTAYTTMLWVYSPWRPSLRVSFKPIAEMFGFGSKILLTNMLNTLNVQLLQGVLGHFFPLRQVGYYSQANKWSLLSNGLLSGMVSSVAQPVLAKVGDSPERQTRVFRKMLRFSAFLAFPLLMGLSLVAPEFIPLAIGEKWLPCVPYLMLLSVSAAFSTVNGVFTHLMVSCGRSNLYLRTTVLLLLLQGLLILLTAGIGNMFLLLIAIAVLQPCWTLYLALTVRGLIAVGIKEMMADVVPFVCAAAFAIFIGWGSSRMVFIDLNCQGWWRLLPMAVKCCAAVCTYFIVMHFVHPDVYQESLDFIKRRLASKTGKFF